MIHRAAAILLALAAATLLPAAKPVPPADPPGGGADDARERWRGQGISVCVAELRAVPSSARTISRGFAAAPSTASWRCAGPRRCRRSKAAASRA